MSFPEKKFKEWAKKERNEGRLIFGGQEDAARWGYSECDKELTPVLEGLMTATKTNFVQGKKEGYEQAENERKARDAKLRELLEREEKKADFTFEKGGLENPRSMVNQPYERGRFDAIHYLKREIEALLLVEKRRRKREQNYS